MILITVPCDRAENRYTQFSASPAVLTIASFPRKFTILAPRLALRNQMGRVPSFAPFRHRGVRLISRNGNTFKSFPNLCDGLARDLKGRHCVLDGEIVCLDADGKPQFRDLLFRRAEPSFIAFDLLWDEHAKSDDEEETHRFRNGEDLRYLPLIDRKVRLHAVVPKKSERLLYCDHIDRDGEALFRLACENDLEGIVAKRKSDPYLPDHATWLKIRNQQYSQWVGREELFERERGSDPDFQVWDACALACEAAQ